MTSLNQVKKANDLAKEGWKSVASGRAEINPVMGGPSLWHKDSNYLILHPDGTTRTPDPKEVEGW